jgi:hypothetical protein
MQQFGPRFQYVGGVVVFSFLALVGGAVVYLPFELWSVIADLVKLEELIQKVEKGKEHYGFSLNFRTPYDVVDIGAP